MVTISRQLPGLMHQGPEMAVRDAGVRAPVDDVARMDNAFRVEHGARAKGDLAAGDARGRADRAVEQRGAQAMEEASIEAFALELAQGAGVAIRQDRLRAVGRLGDGAEARRDGVDRLGPGDAFEAPLPFRPTRFRGYCSRSGW